ncbi:12086_t:CDS:2 [Racocetra fulgida]|uniref:12086_t:CDS:1 n=1 Tax=Racocetra fulgida TaxID=60492 RepID=A0A9N9DAS1_9GLOM|nr:12086_t:CDS:2 [Racocetra fulgida]
MSAQEAADIETPLFQQSIIENEINTQELLDEPDKHVEHGFIEFGDKLIEAQTAPLDRYFIDCNGYSYLYVAAKLWCEETGSILYDVNFGDGGLFLD